MFEQLMLLPEGEAIPKKIVYEFPNYCGEPISAGCGTGRRRAMTFDTPFWRPDGVAHDCGPMSKGNQRPITILLV